MKSLRTFHLVLVGLLFSNFLIAQQVYFCSEVRGDGTPIGHTNNWAVGEDGGVIVVVYDNGMQNIPGGDVLIQIAQKTVTTGKMDVIERFQIPVSAPGNWATLEYHFPKAGDYRVTFLNSREVRLGSGKVTVEIDPSIKSADDRQGKYSKCKVQFCEKVDYSGHPIDQKNVFDFSGGERRFTVHINNKAPLLTDTIFVDVFRYTGNGTDANHIESLDIPVQPSWDHCSFEYSVFEPGEFMLDIFNKNDVWINSAQVKVGK